MALFTVALAVDRWPAGGRSSGCSHPSVPLSSPLAFILCRGPSRAPRGWTVDFVFIAGTLCLMITTLIVSCFVRPAI